MNPGRELDLLIARDVMKFSVDNETKNPLPYSTNITAAFFVVNEMLRRSYDFACEQFYDVYKDDEIVYRVNFGGLNCYCGNWVRGESLPHAICKAALSAIEIEKE